MLNSACQTGAFQNHPSVLPSPARQAPRGCNLQGTALWGAKTGRGGQGWERHGAIYVVIEADQKKPMSEETNTTELGEAWEPYLGSAVWLYSEASWSKTLHLKLPILIRKAGISNYVAFKADHKNSFSHICLHNSSLSHQAELACVHMAWNNWLRSSQYC